MNDIQAIIFGVMICVPVIFLTIIILYDIYKGN